MNAVATDLPRIPTTSVVTLYQWADEFASRPDIKNPLGISPGGSHWKRSDYQDLALSILGAVAAIEPPILREAFRHIAGIDSSRGHDLAGRLADQLQEVKPAWCKNKSRGQILLLADAAFFVYKSQYHWKKPAGLAWYARALGMKRQSLDSANWRDLIWEAESIISKWFHGGKMMVRVELTNRGLFNT